MEPSLRLEDFVTSLQHKQKHTTLIRVLKILTSIRLIAIGSFLLALGVASNPNSSYDCY